MSQPIRLASIKPQIRHNRLALKARLPHGSRRAAWASRDSGTARQTMTISNSPTGRLR
ncbi:hypothetical protein D3C78_1818070 [compost metagenome]